MKVVYIHKDIYLGTEPLRISLFKDTWYVMSDTDILQLKNIAPEKIGDVSDFKKHYKKYDGEDLTGKTILVFRSGGIGDLLFMTPSFRYISLKYPSCKIICAAGFLYKDILENNPYINELHSMPFSKRLLDDADYHLMFEGLIENNSLARTINAYDLFLGHFKIKPDDLTREEKQPIIVLKDEEKKWAEIFLSGRLKVGRPLIGMQIETSTERRTFPSDKTQEIMRVLLEEDFNIVVFGGPRQKPISEAFQVVFKEFYDDRRILFLPLIAEITLRQNIAIASKTDLQINPDSAFVHIAAAFKIPQIGLYGPFHSKVRMYHFTNAIALNGQVACSPCYEHIFWACEKGSPSPCFSVISVDAVLEAVDFLLSWFKYKPLKYSTSRWRNTKSNEALVKFIEYTRGKPGIDIGCGYYKQDFMKRVDINPFTLPDVLGNIEIWKDKEQYDFVFSSYCLNEIKDKEAALKNMFDMVKPGGYLLLYLPCNNSGIPYVEDFTQSMLTELLGSLSDRKDYTIKNYGESFTVEVIKDGL